MRSISCADPLIRNNQSLSNTNLETAEVRRALQIAKDWLVQHAPKDSEILKYEAFVIDRGGFWGVSFMSPGILATGGAPELHIDKKTYAILEISWAH
jgi:hypothetical protein